MMKSRWKLYLIGGGFLAILAGLPLVIGSTGCGGGTTCSVDVADNLTTQEQCNAAVAAFNASTGSNCDPTGQFAGVTGFCTAVNCTNNCPSDGGSE